MVVSRFARTCGKPRLLMRPVRGDGRDDLWEFTAPVAHDGTVCFKVKLRAIGCAPYAKGLNRRFPRAGQMLCTFGQGKSIAMPLKDREMVGQGGKQGVLCGCGPTVDLAPTKLPRHAKAVLRA